MTATHHRIFHRRTGAHACFGGLHSPARRRRMDDGSNLSAQRARDKLHPAHGAFARAPSGERAGGVSTARQVEMNGRLGIRSIGFWFEISVNGRLPWRLRTEREQKLTHPHRGAGRNQRRREEERGCGRRPRHTSGVKTQSRVPAWRENEASGCVSVASSAREIGASG